MIRVHGGSMTAASDLPAVYEAGFTARQPVLDLTRGGWDGAGALA
jgi:hypothetical protein